MGLLTDTFDLYKKQLENLRNVDLEMRMIFLLWTLILIHQVQESKPSLTDRPGGSPLTKPGGNLFPTKYVSTKSRSNGKLGNTTINLPKSVLTKEAAANQAKAIKIVKKYQIKMLVKHNF